MFLLKSQEKNRYKPMHLKYFKSIHKLSRFSLFLLSIGVYCLLYPLFVFRGANFATSVFFSYFVLLLMVTCIAGLVAVLIGEQKLFAAALLTGSIFLLLLLGRGLYFSHYAANSIFYLYKKQVSSNLKYSIIGLTSGFYVFKMVIL